MLGRVTVVRTRGWVVTGIDGAVNTGVGSGSGGGVVASVGTVADDEEGNVVAVSDGTVVVDEVDAEDDDPADDPEPDESAVAEFDAEDELPELRLAGVSLTSRTSSVGVRVGRLASPGSAWYMNFWKM